MKRRRLTLLLVWAGLLALGGSIYLGPYFAAWSIRRAVAAGDAEALRAFVDFEAVRENLKGELRRTVGARQRRAAAPAEPEPAEAEAAPTPEPAPEPEPEEAPLTDLGARLAVTVGETMIDRFATPEGVDRALRARAADGGGGWSSFLDLGGGGDGDEEEDDGGGIEVRASYDGWNDFAVRLGVENEGGDEAPIWADILFERRGIWAWRVTGARVSPDAISLLVR